MSVTEHSPLRYGGIKGGRPLNESDDFEMAVNRALGDRVRGDVEDAQELWGSLANCVWVHEDLRTVLYSFRAAGDLVTAIRGEGSYMDWYCSTTDGWVRRWIADAMSREGWIWDDCADPEAMDTAGGAS